MLIVVVALVLLVSVPLAVVATTTTELPSVTRNLNWDEAYEAAQAGLNDYIQHLDADESYAQYNKGNPGNPANPAFSSWVSVASNPPESYAYAPTVNQGLITLKVSGKAGSGVGTVVRTFVYSVRPRSSLDTVYWSNYETLDPVVSATNPNETPDQAYCATHNGEPSADSYSNWAQLGIPQYGPPTDCIVQFYTGDTIDGPAFSNDTFYVCGSPTFESTVSSGNIYSPSAYIQESASSCSGTATFDDGAPVKVGNTPPQTSTVDLSPAQKYGCYIAGAGNTPTNVTMTLAQSGATTKITWSGSGASVQNAATNTNNCASPITASSLTSALLYVDGTITVSGTVAGGLDIVAGTSSSSTPGNIVIPANITYPAGDIVTANGTSTDPSDALGLIANNSVIAKEVTNLTVDAAILALQDSFYVQNWYQGSYGTLTVFGSIAQNFRGPVGTFGGSGGTTGFTKKYTYDASLQTLWPPYFIPPTGAVWSPTSYGELAQGLAASVCPSC